MNTPRTLWDKVRILVFSCSVSHLTSPKMKKRNHFVNQVKELFGFIAGLEPVYIPPEFPHLPKMVKF